MEDMFSEYDAELADELRYLKGYHGADDENLKEHVMHALELAGNDKADDAMGVTYYYISTAFFTADNLQGASKFCDMACAFMVNSDRYEMLSRIYNMNGIIMMLFGNENMAVDYMMTAIDIVREHGKGRITEGNTYSNIATMFTASGGYDAALPLYKKSWEDLNDEDDDDQLFNMINIHSWIGICLLQTGKTENIDEHERELDAMIAKAENSGKRYPEFSVLLFKTEKVIIMGEDERKDECLTALDSEAAKAHYSEYYAEYKDYTDILLESGDTDKIEHLTRRLSEMAENERYTDYAKINIYSMLIRCCKKNGDTEAVQKYCDKYYELSMERYKNSYKDLRKTMNAHDQIYRLHKSEQKIELANQKLDLEARMDELTGLPNRVGFDRYIHTSFEKIAARDKRFMVEIFDIDSFKSINDTYGHLAGDECLRKIGQCLNALADESGCFAARYGGDEFLVISDGWSMDEVKRFTQRLSEAVRDKNIPNEKSGIKKYVTISQGVYFHNSGEGHIGIMDCFARADRALYKAKKHGRNQCKISRGEKENK
jgi:diguanylate cyclase (GGDEF)-like protein